MKKNPKDVFRVQRNKITAANDGTYEPKTKYVRKTFSEDNKTFIEKVSAKGFRMIILPEKVLASKITAFVEVRKASTVAWKDYFQSLWLNKSKTRRNFKH